MTRGGKLSVGLRIAIGGALGLLAWGLVFAAIRLVAGAGA